MNSSAKFLSPTVMVGFGPVVDDVVVVVLLPPPPPPQAVIPIRSATPNEIANAALAARRVCFRNIVASSLDCPPPGPYALGAIRREAARCASARTPAARSARPANQMAGANVPPSPSVTLRA